MFLFQILFLSRENQKINKGKLMPAAVLYTSDDWWDPDVELYQ